MLLVWDNSFSWWTAKTLRYSVHLRYENRSSSSVGGTGTGATGTGATGSGSTTPAVALTPVPTTTPGSSSSSRRGALTPGDRSERRRSEMLVTLCNVMRQLHDNQQKIAQLGKWYQTETASLVDLQVPWS